MERLPWSLTRLLLGFASNLPALLEAEFPENHAQFVAAFNKIRPMISVPLVQAAMPLQDAIDLARYLADLTIKFSTFAPGASIVGGPIEIAAVTKHEGFKWVTRKYYFDSSFNPDEDDVHV